MINTKVVNPRKRQFHASLLNRKWVAAKMVNKIQGRSEPSPNSSANSVAWTRKHLRPLLLPDEIFSALFCYSEPAVGPVPNNRTNLFVFEGFWRVTGKAIWSRTEPFRPRNFWKAGRFGFGTTWYVLNPRSFVICGLLVHPVCPYTVHLPAHPIFVTHLHTDTFSVRYVLTWRSFYVWALFACEFVAHQAGFPRLKVDHM